jgi:HEAT repeat protein
MCYVSDEPEVNKSNEYVNDAPESRKPSFTRTQFYDKAVIKLLDQPKETFRYPEGKEPSRGQRRIVLENIALDLFLQDDEILIFNEDQIRISIEKTLKDLGYQDFGSLVRPFISDFVLNSGLLRSNNELGYFFLHLTFQEFLAASALARLINENGWEAKLKIGNKEIPVKIIIDHKAWDPKWKEVIIFLAGQLEDPKPLLEMLADPKPTDTNPNGDDMFRYRLALAAMCLPEIKEETRKQVEVSEVVNKITADAFSLWWQYSKDWYHIVSHIGKILPHLIEINAKVNISDLSRPDELSSQIPIVQCLTNTLLNPNKEIRQIMIGALTFSGTLPAQPELISALINDLPKEDRLIQIIIVKILEEMGEGAFKAETVLSFINCLKYSEEDYTDEREVLRKIEKSVTQQEVIFTLIKGLSNEDKKIRIQTAETICKIKEYVAQQTELISTLIKSLLSGLSDDDEEIRIRAAKAIRRFGKYIAQPEIISALILCLKNQNIHEIAAEALNSMEEYATKEAISALIDYLCDPNVQDDFDKWLNLFCHLSMIVTVVDNQEILSTYLKFIQKVNNKLRESAIGELSLMTEEGIIENENLKETNAKSKVIAVLLPCLQYPNSYIREGALVSLINIKEAIAKPEVVAAFLTDLSIPFMSWHLIPHLNDVLADCDVKSKVSAVIPYLQNQYVSMEAAKLLDKMKECKEVKPEIVSAFINCLNNQDQDMRVRSIAIEALASMKECEEFKSKIMPVIINCLYDREAYIRAISVLVLASMKEYATQSEVVAIFMSCLRGPINWTFGIETLGYSTVHYSLGEVLMISNIGITRELISVLVKGLYDQDSVIRMHAAEALIFIGKATIEPSKILANLEYEHIAHAIIQFIQSGIRMFGNITNIKEAIFKPLSELTKF